MNTTKKNWALFEGILRLLEDEQVRLSTTADSPRHPCVNLELNDLQPFTTTSTGEISREQSVTRMAKCQGLKKNFSTFEVSVLWHRACDRHHEQA